MCEPYSLWFRPMLFQGLSYKSNFWFDWVQFVSFLFVQENHVMLLTSFITIVAVLRKAVFVVLVYEIWHALTSSHVRWLLTCSQKRICFISSSGAYFRHKPQAKMFMRANLDNEVHIFILISLSILMTQDVAIHVFFLALKYECTHFVYSGLGYV